ncbi:MAG: phosphonate C-P lyase system protein PhnH [Inquilinaceae bacterium]
MTVSPVGQSSDPTPVPDTGFADPVFDSQAVFRRVLFALSRPGLRQPVDRPASVPSPLTRPTAGVALTLLDHDTPVWLDSVLRVAPVASYLRFHCGCPLVSAPEDADFALIGDIAAIPPLVRFRQGEDRYPDRSATLVLQCPSLDGGPARRLTGPGIDGAVTVAPAGLADAFWDEWAANGALYPLGVDIVLTDGQSLLGLPRTARCVPLNGS